MSLVNSLRKSSKVICATALSLVAIATWVPASYARDARNAQRREKLLKTHITLTAKRHTLRPIQQVHLGSAPYICTPSGFGRMGQCFLRLSAD